MPRTAVNDRIELAAIAERAREHADEPLVVGLGDDQAVVGDELRDTFLSLLEILVRAAGHDTTLDISILTGELTTGQAADLLGVSRPTVVKLIDQGELPATRVGTRRRLVAKDVLAYRHRSRKTRKDAVDEIIAASQELDLY